MVGDKFRDRIFSAENNIQPFLLERNVSSFVNQNICTDLFNKVQFDASFNAW